MVGCVVIAAVIFVVMILAIKFEEYWEVDENGNIVIYFRRIEDNENSELE